MYHQAWACTPIFRHLTFRQETFRHGHFITGTFRHGDFLAPWTFRHMDILYLWTFWHGDFLAHGYLGMQTFRHRDISAQRHWRFWHKDSAKICYYCAEKSIFPKCPCAKRSPCQNIQLSKCPCAKKSLCRKVHVPNSLLAETSMEMKCPFRKVFCRNVRCRNKPRSFLRPLYFCMQINLRYFQLDF